MGTKRVHERNKHFAWNILKVKVQDGLALAPFHDVLHQRNLIRSDIAPFVHEVQLLEFGICVFVSLSLACGGPVQGRVVHQHDYAVLGQPRVDFIECRHGFENLVEGLYAVLWIAGHVSAPVTAYNDVIRVDCEICVYICNAVACIMIRIPCRGAPCQDCCQCKCCYERFHEIVIRLNVC